MTELSEFVRQNGAFGVLVGLIAAAAKWGLPYVARKFDELAAEGRRQVNELVAGHRAQVDQVIEDHRAERAEVNAQFTASMDKATNALHEVKTGLTELAAEHKRSATDTDHRLQALEVAVKNRKGG